MEMNTDFTILIVDDAGSLRSLIRKSLEGAGYGRVKEAINGRAALGVLAQTRVDLIISDLNMPQVNGLELLRTVQESPAYCNIPFIVLTSETANDTFQAAMRAGAADFIKKPFTRDDLINKIQSIIAWS